MKECPRCQRPLSMMEEIFHECADDAVRLEGRLREAQVAIDWKSLKEEIDQWAGHAVHLNDEHLFVGSWVYQQFAPRLKLTEKQARSHEGNSHRLMGELKREAARAEDLKEKRDTVVQMRDVMHKRAQEAEARWAEAKETLKVVSRAIGSIRELTREQQPDPKVEALTTQAILAIKMLLKPNIVG